MMISSNQTFTLVSTKRSLSRPPDELLTLVNHSEIHPATARPDLTPDVPLVPRSRMGPACGLQTTGLGK